MQTIEELGDILSLGTDTRASRVDNRWIQSQPLRDIQASGGTRDSNAQFVSWLKRVLVEADGGVENARSIRSINFQRCVVGGDHGHSTHAPEVIGNCYGKRCAFFRIGRRA